MGTSNVLAGQQFGMATYGTQAHSWVMAHEDEADAFRHFLDAFPDGAVLLLDTYDVRNALEKIIAMGRKPAGVRLDSGDLAKDSRWVRRQLDRAGWNDVKIFASGDLDEFRICGAAGRRRSDRCIRRGHGAGHAGRCAAAEHDLQAGGSGARRKNARGREAHAAKATYPGRKQVYRYFTAKGEFKSDRIALESEAAEWRQSRC